MIPPKKRGAPKGCKGGPGRNKLPPGKRRVRLATTVSLETAVAIGVQAQIQGISPGCVIDSMVRRSLVSPPS